MTISVNTWIVAGTSILQRYPCRCGGGRSCSPLWCPCAGRVDYVGMPAGCCAWVHVPPVAAAAQREYDRSRGWS